MQTETSILERFHFAILIAFLFMIFSRIFDMYLKWLHLPGISYRLVGLFLLMTGTFVTAFRDRIGKSVLGFTACFLISIPFSVWRTGSLQTLSEQWLVGFVVFVATASLISDFSQYLRAAKTIAFALLVLTAICLILGRVENGRLFLERGRFANPNEMAQAMLLGLPFWWALYSTFHSLLARLLAGFSMILMLVVVGRTGSRGALVSLLVVAALMFLRASVVGRIKLLVAGGMLLVLAILALPSTLRTRYQIFFSPEEPVASLSPPGDDTPADPHMVTSALASTTSRQNMLKRSLVITLRHPLLGVGPGMFMVAENDIARAEGKRKGAWLGTHNGFTEVSSECGIPALLFYTAIVVFSLKDSYSLYRRSKDNPKLHELSSHALALNYSLIVFVLTSMFVHAAYTALLPVLAGLTVSLARVAQPLVPVPARQPGMPVFVRQRSAWPAQVANQPG